VNPKAITAILILVGFAAFWGLVALAGNWCIQRAVEIITK
jgi:hypothetical protein